MASKKSPAKKNAPAKDADKKPVGTKKATPPSISEVPPQINQSPVTVPATPEPKQSPNCKCIQRKTKFYCYQLIQGRWVQASGLGYPSKRMCEENCCA